MIAHSIPSVTEDLLLEALTLDRQADHLASVGRYEQADLCREVARQKRALAERVA